MSSDLKWLSQIHPGRQKSQPKTLVFKLLFILPSSGVQCTCHIGVEGVMV